MLHATETIHAGSPQLTELPARFAAVVRIDAPADELPRLLAEAFDVTARAITTSGATFAGPPFARYLDFGTIVSAEVGFPYTGRFEATDRVFRTQLPGGRAVKATHVGPYAAVAATWEATQAWIREQGLVPAGAPWESYLTGPDASPPITEIVFPIS